MEVETIYGLCNRLQTIIGFYTYCGGKKLNIVWKKNKECPGNFEDYFHPVLNVNFLKEKTTQNAGRFYKFNKLRYNVDNNFEELVLKNYTLIQPKIYIKEIIEKMKVGSMIGLHIRRTDFLPYIKKYYPRKVQELDDNYFLKIIREILVSNPNQQFYLATDNSYTQKLFFRLFPKNIKFYKIIKESKEIRKTSLEDSVIDLFSLVNTKEFYGTKESSFSDFVEKIRLNKII